MAKVLDVLNEYAYRKQFRLSYQEFLKEDFDVYSHNLQIMAVQADIDRAILRKSERQAKIK